MNEVKRQALSELQKAIATAEQRAGELLSQERSKMQREVEDARRKTREEVMREFNRQEESTEVRPAWWEGLSGATNGNLLLLLFF